MDGYWWLRSPGNDSYDAAYMDNDGWGYGSGDCVYNDSEAIRPALRINLSSSVWEAAGTVSTEPGAIDPDQPTQTPKPTDAPQATTTPEVTKTPEPTAEPTKLPTPTNAPKVTATPDVTKTPEPTAKPTSTPEPTKTPEVTPTPSPSKAPVISATPTPTPALANDSTQTSDDKPQLKTIKLSSVVCKRNTTKISGKVSVSGATVKIKVGGKAYKKATVKGKKFTLKVAKLKKKTKVIIKVTNRGYKSLSKIYKVK